MTQPCYINLAQARQVLAEMGVELTDRQIKRASETDARGQRKLPFFVDPIEGKLKIEKGTCSISTVGFRLMPKTA